MNELTMLYHTREEMEVMHRLVQQAIDADDEAGFQMLNSLRTMWAEAIYGVEDEPRVPMPATLVKLTLTNLDHLVAVMTGAVGRVESAGGIEAAQQLRDLRLHLLNEDLQLRERVGLPTT